MAYAVPGQLPVYKVAAAVDGKARIPCERRCADVIFITDAAYRRVGMEARQYGIDGAQNQA